MLSPHHVRLRGRPPKCVLPASEYKNALLSATYAVVVFSILVQGLTVERLVRALLGESGNGEPHDVGRVGRFSYRDIWRAAAEKFYSEKNGYRE